MRTDRGLCYCANRPLIPLTLHPGCLLPRHPGFAFEALLLAPDQDLCDSSGRNFDARCAPARVASALPSPVISYACSMTRVSGIALRPSSVKTAAAAISRPGQGRFGSTALSVITATGARPPKNEIATL